MEQDIQVIKEEIEQEITIEKEDIGTIPSGTKQITQNGTYDVGKYKYAEVNTPIPTGTTNITSNGEYNVYDYATANVNVPEPTGTIQITSNGETNVKDYEIANVNVPQPSGTINITANGEYDVSQYANASVNTPAGLNWGALGYSGEPSLIINGYDYAIQIKNNWVDETLYQKYQYNTQLTFFPKVSSTQATDMRRAFLNCKNLIYGDFSLFNTTNTTRMEYMFAYCTSLRELDLSSFYTSNLQRTANMFLYCVSLAKIDMRNFSLSQITTSSYYTNMFGSSNKDGPADDCLIIVKNNTEKQWITSKFSRLTNVKTIDEYNAM